MIGMWGLGRHHGMRRSCVSPGQRHPLQAVAVLFSRSDWRGRQASRHARFQHRPWSAFILFIPPLMLVCLALVGTCKTVNAGPAVA